MKKTLIILMLFLLATLCACGKSEPEGDTTSETVTVISTTAEDPTVAPTEATATTQKATTAAAKVETTTEKEVTSVFTADSSNKFIQTISTTYGVDPKLLACIYSTTGNDANYVMQFDGSVDANGKYIKNPDTLKYVYALTADCKKIQKTDGADENVGCSKVNGVFVFEACKQLLVPHFQDELNAS